MGNSGRNNNSMALSSRLIITDPPTTSECTKNRVGSTMEIDTNVQAKFGENFNGSADNIAVDIPSEDKGLTFLN